MALVLTGATIEVTNDGSGVVSAGPIYKKERDVNLNFELDSVESNPISNTFAQDDIYFATTSRKATCSFTSVLGKVTESTDIDGALVDFLKISNLSVAEGTAVGGKKVYDFTPNSTGEGKGEITIKNTDRTVVLEKCASSIAIEVQRGGEVEITFNISGYVKTDTAATNTLADPVKPVTAVLTTTDGTNTGITVDGSIIDPQSLSFSMNLDITMPPVMVSANQLVVINGAKHTLSVSAYLSSSVFEEGYSSIVAGDTIAIDANFEDTSDTVIWELAVPVAKVSGTPNRNDNSGAYSITKEYLCRPTSGNDNFTLKYYSNITA